MTGRKAWRLSACGLLLLCASEACLQLLGFGHPPLVTTASPAQYEPVPNQSTWRVWPMSDSLIAHVRTNRYGMRSESIDAKKRANTCRIYFLGDSITWGTTQVDQNQLFTEILHRELPNRLHEPVEVMNGSISGWAIANEFAFLKEHGALEADRIILVLNDGDPTQPLAPAPVDDAIPSLAHHPTFALQELLDRGVRPKLIQLAQKAGIDWSATSTKDPGLDINPDLMVLRANLLLLGDMEAFVRSQGSKMSILYIPFQGLRDDNSAYARAQIGRRAIERWAESNGVPFVDLGPSMSRFPVDQVLLRDHAHFNVAGHRAIAAQIEAHWSDLTTDRHSEVVE